ncbi:MAG: serine/threonine-protein phosphatase [Deltaproteobacteria bacterium CG_4_10_14_0_2_um_filter_43_8]|nr:MAG: protein phosphatase [Deltaproteobacteria bacterium CG11_big_fil_rev_8_21_14_0_20_42_23]PJA20697.1 MAG: serine/threonine-protein phosphatase [Deltaproteobacteria bacterium CG_4_10_14_0_2_um_filter_43_8]PJC64428.1 MAG: serine/threonine-protein phosphatase [Deltaproteobacteria bacterium CG_4_9_14_0_2_um_filter_42_21]
MIFRLKAATATNIGKRENNEDTFLVNEGLGLFIVADGMGGHARGEVASQFASLQLEDIIDDISDEEEQSIDDALPNLQDEDLLTQAVLSINYDLYKRNEELMKSEETNNLPDILKKRKRMGTTLVSLFVKEKKAYIVHVGDSRAYCYRKNKLQQITQDHTWVEEQVKEGKLTPEEALVHVKRNVITRSVGFKPEVKVDIDVVHLEEGDRFLLCSDGLSNMLKEGELKGLLEKSGTKEACERMVEIAKDIGGRDNITALVVDVIPNTSSDEPEITIE